MIQRINKSHSGASGKKRSGFSYQRRSEKSVRERAEQTGGRFDSPFKPGFDTFRPKPGDNLIRILPPTWEGEHENFGMDIWVHGWVGPDNGSYLCLSKMKGKPCPICDAAKECKDAGEADDAKKLEAKRRVLTWILDRDGEDPNQPVLYSMSWTTDRDINALCTNKRTGKVLYIDNPDEGYDIQFKRKGTTATNTEYYAWQVDRDSSPLSDSPKEQEKILEFIQENPLDSVLKYYNAEYLEKVMSGAVEQKDPDEEEEEETKTRDEDEEEDRPRRSKAKDDDEIVEEIPRNKRVRSDEDEEEEDERPSRRRAGDADDEEEDDRPKRRAKADEEEEGEEETRPTKRVRTRRGDDDEEEEEQPSRSRRSKDDDEEEEEPRSKRSRDDGDEEDDDRPVRSKSRRSKDDDEEEDD